MKKLLLLLFAIIPILLGPLITVMPSLAILNSASKVLGSVPIPIFELPFILIYIASIKLLWKFNFGFKINKFTIPILAVIPALLVIIVNIWTSNSLNILLNQLPASQVILATLTSLVSATIIGIFEETVFRGVLFNYAIFIFRKTNKPILFAGLLSSTIFGMVHLSNSLIGGADIGYTIHQIVSGISIGFLFAMVYVKTQSLWAPIILHSVIDWSDLIFNIAGEQSISGINIPIVIVTIVYAISGYIIYRSIKNEPIPLGFKI